MGVDIYDVDAQGDYIEGGAYFRSNWWCWRPVVACMERFAPDIWERAGEQGMNSGEGLTAADAHALAAVLTAADAVGDLQRWVDEWEATRNAAPDEVCHICLGDGVRTPEDDVRLLGHPLPGHDAPTRCNGCSGTGRVRPGWTSYPAEYDRLLRWRDFLAAVTHRFATW